jgi:hypothetical protein
MVARPPSTTIDAKTITTGQVLEAWRYKADLARFRVVEMFLDRSGDLANTTDVHRIMRSGLIGMQESGFDAGPMLALLDEGSRLSPDKDGKSRKEVLQLLEESPIIIPGIGATGLHAPIEEIGRFEHLKRMVLGNPAGG